MRFQLPPTLLLACLAVTASAADRPPGVDGPFAVARTVPADRLLGVAEDVLRASGADEAIGPLLLTSRAVLGAAFVDTTRPLTGSLAIDADRETARRSARLLVPVPGRTLDVSAGELHLSEGGVRRATPDDPDGEVAAASVGDGWALLGPRLELITADDRAAFADVFERPPPPLASLTAGGGVLPPATVAELVRAWESGVAEETRRKPDEPVEVHVLRSEVQLAVVAALVEAVRTLDSAAVSLDVAGGDDAGEATIDAAVRWTDGSRVGRELSRVEPVASSLNVAETATAAARLHFRLPPRTGMRLERWAESAAAATRKLLRDADREDLSPAVGAFAEALSEWVREGVVDATLELHESDGRPYAVAGLAFDAAGTLAEVVKLIEAGGGSVYVETRGEATVYRFGDESDAGSPFGPDARAWFVAGAGQVWMLLGTEGHLDEVVARVGVATRPSSRPINAVRVTVDAAAVARMQIAAGESSEEGLPAIAPFLGGDTPPIEWTVRPADGGLDTTLRVPAAVTRAAVRAVVEAARDGSP